MIGLEKLLEPRGPNMHCFPKVFQIYKGVRRMTIFASLSTRRPSILARGEWRRIPWTDCLDGEIEEQYLLDALADCMVLVSGRDKVVEN